VTGVDLSKKWGEQTKILGSEGPGGNT